MAMTVEQKMDRFSQIMKVPREMVTEKWVGNITEKKLELLDNVIKIITSGVETSHCKILKALVSEAAEEFRRREIQNTKCG